MQRQFLKHEPYVSASTYTRMQILRRICLPLYPAIVDLEGEIRSVTDPRVGGKQWQQQVVTFVCYLTNASIPLSYTSRLLSPSTTVSINLFFFQSLCQIFLCAHTTSSPIFLIFSRVCFVVQRTDIEYFVRRCVFFRLDSFLAHIPVCCLASLQFLGRKWTHADHHLHVFVDRHWGTFAHDHTLVETGGWAGWRGEGRWWRWKGGGGSWNGRRSWRSR